MRAASRGDADAYRRALAELAPILRGLAKRGFSRYGLGPEEVAGLQLFLDRAAALGLGPRRAVAFF